MKVTFDGGLLRIKDAGRETIPTAADIYAVLFEDVTIIEGKPVSQEDFVHTGLNFSTSTALPILVLRASDSSSGKTVNWSLEARHGPNTAPVARKGDEFLDYAIIGGRWLPLPFGCGRQAVEFMRSLGSDPDGTLPLTSYLQLFAKLPEGFEVEDETDLSAVALAGSLNAVVPAGFTGRLYPYQTSGVAWLRFMHEQGVGCILADEMGLGKSVQIVCLALHAVANLKLVLIVAPATLLENWRREFKKFAPELKVLVHRGARRAGLVEEFGTYNVVITSFETAVSDISMLMGLTWALVVVDEAQGIKNPDARRTRALKRIPRQTAVAVTGTPVENSLKDLWSLTDFVAPTVLGTLSEFERRHPDSRDGAELVEPRVSPLILRRRVSDVAKDLPERIDIPIAFELDDASVAEYDRLRAEALQKYGRSGGLVALTTLRMFCAHPWLVGTGGGTDATALSPKLARLIEMIEEISASNEKALVFTSYNAAEDLLCAEIARLGLPAFTLDGRTPIIQRQKHVDEFTALSGSSVLVLNPKAAGTGLNITAANHVIHYTPEWNPAVEDQASARAHRRGQTKSVRVYRLFYAGTVEELMHQRMDAKRELASTAVVGSDGEAVDLNDVARALDISPVTQ